MVEKSGGIQLSNYHPVLLVYLPYHSSNEVFVHFQLILGGRMTGDINKNDCNQKDWKDLQNTFHFTFLFNLNAVRSFSSANCDKFIIV
jgi:hypothetical protein